MPGGLKKKSDRTELDLTPKQKMFVEIYVQDWGNITQAEALKRAGYVCTNEKDYGSVASRMLSRKHSPHIAKYFDKLFEREVKKYEKKNNTQQPSMQNIGLVN
jgi:phage terminase small subunit